MQARALCFTGHHLRNHSFSLQNMQTHPGIHYIEVVDSTNPEMWRMIDSGEHIDEFAVIQAGKQLKGRGLGTTSWESEAGKNLLFSVFLKPDFLPPQRQFMLSKVITLGIREALASIHSYTDFLIKWPNDIYAGHRKIAGNLIETRIMGKKLQACVAGTGININQENFPEHIPNPVSLKTLSGISHDIKAVLHKILHYIRDYYFLLKTGHHDQLNEAYLDHLLGFEKTMTYSKDGRKFKATLKGVSDLGKLQLADVSGNLAEYDLKEVSLII